MSRRNDLLAQPSFQRGLDLILEAIAAQQAEYRLSDAVEQFDPQQLDRIARLRGRPLFFPYLGSGLGRGARVRTADGRWLLDLAIGIGVHFLVTVIQICCEPLSLQRRVILSCRGISRPTPNMATYSRSC